MIENSPTQLRISSAKLIKCIAQNCLASLTLFTGISLAGVNLPNSVFAPQIVQAYPAKVEVSLERQRGEDYETLLRRAEVVAQEAVQRSFDGNTSLTEVSITVLGQNEGAIAPILSLEVNRQTWTKRPDPQQWATYFSGAKSLLRFDSTGVKMPSASDPKSPTMPSASGSLKPPTWKIFGQ